MRSNNRTLLIDADILIYQAAFGAEEDLSFDEETYHSTADLPVAQSLFSTKLSRLQDKFEADAILCLSCPTGRYHRHAIYPQYKAPRGKVRKPLLLKPLRSWVEETYITAIKTNMEADDVVGILATNHEIIPGKKCVVSKDKDLNQIPGPHLSLDDPSLTLYSVTQEEGDRLHLLQTLSGDVVDNYPGCPGIGKGRAGAFLDDPVIWTKTEKTIQRGPNAGTIKTVWASEPTEDIWAGIVSLYQKQGGTEEDAFLMAQVARILTADLYDFKTRSPLLWRP